jgi:hypothetical protein
MSIKVLVAYHKKYFLPQDPMYLPVHVGKKGKAEDLGLVGDDTGENISEKNPGFCELTALYWGWKNLSSDYLGLAHYRRHFAKNKGLFPKKPSKRWDLILRQDEAVELLSEFDIILPCKRKYYIETLYSHYKNSHKVKDLDITLGIIERDYPEYKQACSTVMNRRWAYMFNMFIMKKEYYDEYCNWLFDILFKLEDELDLSTYSPFEARVFGRISELLLNVWIYKNSYKYIEIPVLFMEKQNYIHKYSMFVLRKMGIVKVNHRY